MEMKLLDALKKQCETTLYNIQPLLLGCPLDEELGEEPVGRLLYAAMYRFDCTLIPRGDYRRDPAFHSPELADLTRTYGGKIPGKEQLIDYYLDLKARLFLQLDELDSDRLLEITRPNGDSAADRILWELQRLSYRIGQISTLAFLRTGKAFPFNDGR